MHRREVKNDYKLFISYERRDSAGWSMTLYSQLVARFGEGTVFRDSQELPAGSKWKGRLSRYVENCQGFVLVIGPDWKEQRVLQKLRDPESWVRKEILAALELRKPIFPVLVGGATAPDSGVLPLDIRPALDDNNHFHFHDGPSWREEFKRLCTDIENVIGLGEAPRQSTAATVPAGHVICLLDRNLELTSLRQGYTANRRLFLARGGKRAGFSYFATRCALDVVVQANSSSAGQQVRESAALPALSWSRFSDPDDSQLRRLMLFREIASAVFGRSAELADGDVESWVKQSIRATRRPMVIHAKVALGSPVDKQRMDEWASIWREVLAGTESSPIAVILFVEAGWLPWSSPNFSSMKSESHVVSPSFGKVPRRYFDEWVDSDVPRLAGEMLKPKIRETGNRLYSMFHRERDFDDISDEIHKIWLEHGDR